MTRQETQNNLVWCKRLGGVTGRPAEHVAVDASRRRRKSRGSSSTIRCWLHRSFHENGKVKHEILAELAALQITRSMPHGHTEAV